MNGIAQHDADFIGLAVDIVGAYFTNNNIPSSELASLIPAVYAALV